MMSEQVAVQGDASLVTSTVTSEPENNNNNVSNNNNNAPNTCKGLATKKEGKLPPCSSISNNSFLWDPDVDGEMVNMPLAPQLITEVPPGEELDDLTELIGPELATLVTATPGLALTILTADCQPVLFADREAQVIGAAHAGWKGALAGAGLEAVTELLAQGLI